MDSEKKVIELYLQGKKLTEIGFEVFGAKGSICRVLTILRSHPESGYVPGRRTTRRHKYKFDETFFERIDTEAKVYYFGLMCSDGWIKYINHHPMAVCLELQSIDRAIIEAWREVMGDNNVRIPERTQGGCEKSRIAFHSVKLARDLESLFGCDHDKTHHLGDVTSLVPNELMRHFVRGIFDGDGSLNLEKYRLRIGIRGTMPLLRGLTRVIPVPTKITIGTQKWPALRTDTNEAAVRFLFWIYDGANFFLLRKWEKCQSGFSSRGLKKTPNIGENPEVGNAEGQSARKARNDYQGASL